MRNDEWLTKNCRRSDLAEIKSLQIQQVANEKEIMDILLASTDEAGTSHDLATTILKQVSLLYEQIFSTLTHTRTERQSMRESKVLSTMTCIEAKLERIFARESSRNSPITAQSLDASTPDGRQKWMELGRLLREEGITPKMIKKNQNKMVRAMKQTLVQSSSSNSSFQTAFESMPPSFAATPQSYQRNLSGAAHTEEQPHSYAFVAQSSKPRQGAIFPSSYTEHEQSARGTISEQRAKHNSWNLFALRWHGCQGTWRYTSVCSARGTCSLFNYTWS